MTDLEQQKLLLKKLRRAAALARLLNAKRPYMANKATNLEKEVRVSKERGQGCAS